MEHALQLDMLEIMLDEGTRERDNGKKAMRTVAVLLLLGLLSLVAAMVWINGFVDDIFKPLLEAQLNQTR